MLSSSVPPERSTRRASESQPAVSETCSITSPAHTQVEARVGQRPRPVRVDRGRTRAGDGAPAPGAAAHRRRRRRGPARPRAAALPRAALRRSRRRAARIAGPHVGQQKPPAQLAEARRRCRVRRAAAASSSSWCSRVSIGVRRRRERVVPCMRRSFIPAQSAREREYVAAVERVRDRAKLRAGHEGRVRQPARPPIPTASGATRDACCRRCARRHAATMRCSRPIALGEHQDAERGRASTRPGWTGRCCAAPCPMVVTLHDLARAEAAQRVPARRHAPAPAPPRGAARGAA